ncbi:MAG: terminase gpA endonuclease subunit [Desulfovibrio sp.]
MQSPIKLYAGERSVYESQPWKSTADFASEDFVLVAGPYAGQKFRHDRAPYARWIMDLWDMPSLRKLFLVAPSQTTKTTIAYACLCSEIRRDPASFGVGMPDESTMKRILEEKLGPHFKRSPVLRELLSSDARQAIRRDAIQMRFGTGYGMFAGSDASASSVSLRVIVLDEEDAYLDKQAVYRMEERALSYEEEAKILRASKVRGTESESTIWRDMRREAQSIYQVEAVCPNCGCAQIMTKERIRVPQGVRDPKVILQQRMAWYECEGCAMRWNDHYRNLAVARGRLVTDTPVPHPQTVGVVIPSWCSRSVSLSKVAADWFTALERGTPKAMAWFDNSHSSKPYKVVSVKTSEDQIRARVLHDRPARVVPAGAVALTLGIDTQKASYYFVVRAWAYSLESWLVDYGELPNDTALHDQIFKTAYPVEGRDDVVMPIWRAAIDVGGTEDKSHEQGWSRSLQVKMLLQEWDSDRVFGVKGASRAQDKTVRRTEVGVDKDVPREFQENMHLYILDTVDLKDLVLMTRMHQESLQPMWLHAEAGEDYIRQLCAEEREDGKNGRSVWVQKKSANHYLDCEVYAAALAHPDWTPALQTLSSPFYKYLDTPRAQRRAPVSGLAGKLSGRNLNPFAR